MKSFIYFLSLLILVIGTEALAKNDSCTDSATTTVAVLIDISDPLDAPGSLAYKKLVDRILVEAPDHSIVDVYKISVDSNALGDPFFSACKPAPKSTNSLFSGEKYWEKKRQKEFYKPLREALIKLADNSDQAKTSPILETLFNISLRSFSSGVKSNSGKVIVVSDFMQNSELVSFYGNKIPEYSAWQRSVDGRTWVKKFNKVTVEAVVIPRHGTNGLTVKGRDFFFSYLRDNFSCSIWHDLASSINKVQNTNGCK